MNFYLKSISFLLAFVSMLTFSSCSEEETNIVEPSDEASVASIQQAEVSSINTYDVEIRWGSSLWIDSPVDFILGSRSSQRVVDIDIESTDGGETLEGTIRYAGEGSIGFRAFHTGNNFYDTEVQYGGPLAPWRGGGQWLIGARNTQRVVALDVSALTDNFALEGKMRYAGEGEIFFRATSL